MNARDPGTDATFDWLREAHRSERAPEELRRRAHEQARRAPAGSLRAPPRSKWLSRGGGLALAAIVAAGGWLTFARPALDVAPTQTTAAGDVTTPTAEPSRASTPEVPCPHSPEWLRSPDEID